MKPLKVQKNGGGGEEMEEEGVNPFEVFPENVWLKILGDESLDPKDLISVSKTCWDLNDMVEKKRLEWVPPVRMVLPLVMKYLTKEEIYALRLASRRTCQDVDKWLVSHPHQRIYNNSSYTFVNRQLGKVIRSNIYYKRESAEEFVAKMANNFHPDDNPFLGRSLSIKLCEKWDQWIHLHFILNVINLILPAPPVRDHIWHVRIGLDDYMFKDGRLLIKLLRKIFLCVKNIRTVFVDLRGGCYIYSLEEPEFWEKASFPPLKHSLPLFVEYGDTDEPIHPLIKQVLVNSYHSQLTKIYLDVTHSDRFLTEYHCPYLRSLELVRMTLRDLVHLKRFDAPLLEKLRLGFTFTQQIVFIKDIKGGNFSFKIAAIVLRRFPKLRMLDLYGISSLIQVSSCLWDRKFGMCFPDPKLSPAGKQAVKKHDWEHHVMVMWLLLPTVNEISLNYIKLLRPKKKVPKIGGM